MSTWYVYLIRTRSGTLYAGTTTDVARRFAEHRRGGKRGSKYLRSRGPLTLVYQAEMGNRAQACRVECRIKRLTKREKEEIVAAGLTASGLLAYLGLTPRS
jgi:putative endonuclease